MTTFCSSSECNARNALPDRSDDIKGVSMLRRTAKLLTNWTMSQLKLVVTAKRLLLAICSEQWLKKGQNTPKVMKNDISNIELFFKAT